MVLGEQAIVNQLCKLVEEFTEVKKLLRASEDRIIDVFYVTVPEAGGTRSFSVGITKIDFKTGAITNPDGTIDTLTRRLDLTQEKDFMHSISIHSNCDVKFRLDSAGQQTIDAQFLFQLPYVTYTTLEIECTATTNISIFACTNPQATLGNFKVSDMTQQTILGDGVELDTYDSITSLLSNLNRIRYQIKILSGEANWDDAPGTDLSSVAGDISTHAAESVDVHGVGIGNSVASDADIATHEADTSVHGVAEVADKATVTAEIDSDVSTHGAVSTNIHGVGVGNSVASDADIATHEADTSVHGVAEVADKATVTAEIDNDISTHGAVSTNIHGVGAGNSVASDDDIATHEADISVHGVAEVADKATVSTEIDSDVSTHGAVSTNIHGVGVGNSVASDDDIATHEADISVHGVAEVADKATVTAEIDADIVTHAAVSVDVHGVGVGNSVASDADIAAMPQRASDSYNGDNTVNRAIPHGLGVEPKYIKLVTFSDEGFREIWDSKVRYTVSTASAQFTVTSWDNTNFYVGNAGGYSGSANATGETYHWVMFT